MIILNPITRQNVARVLSQTLNANYPVTLQKRIMNDMLWAITCDSDEGQIDGIKYSQVYWSTGAIKRRNKLKKTCNVHFKCVLLRYNNYGERQYGNIRFD